MKLTLKEPREVSLGIYTNSNYHYPRETRLCIQILYRRFVLDSNEYKGGFDVLTSRGNIHLKSDSSGSVILIDAEVKESRIGDQSILNIYSKPLSRNEIHEIDKKLGANDITYWWNIEAHGYLTGNTEQPISNPSLIDIEIGSDTWQNLSRNLFIKQVLANITIIKSQFIELTIEPINIDNIRDIKLRTGIKLIQQKQKLLLGTIDKIAEAKTATEFRGIIDEVRKTVETLNRSSSLREVCRKAVKTLCIEPNGNQAINEASEEMISSILGSPRNDKRLTGLTEVTFSYASRFGIHTQTLAGNAYTPTPTKIEAEFAIHQALIELNYLTKLLNTYATHI